MITAQISPDKTHIIVNVPERNEWGEDTICQHYIGRDEAFQLYEQLGAALGISPATGPWRTDFENVKSDTIYLWKDLYGQLRLCAGFPHDLFIIDGYRFADINTEVTE